MTTRLDVLPVDAMDEQQRAVHDAIVTGPRGSVHGRSIGLSGPFNAWIRSPALADAAQRLGAHLRFGANLPAKLTELAILVVGQHTRARFEFAAHAPLARAAGLAEATIEALRRGEPPPSLDADERCVYAVACSLVAQHDLDDATYQDALARFGERGLVELVATVGYYGLVSLTLNTFRVPLRDGMVDPFPDHEPA